jgi:hypothetical protein
MDAKYEKYEHAADVAAAWWTDQFRPSEQAPTDAGDADLNFFLFLGRARSNLPSEETLAQFQSILAAKLRPLVEKADSKYGVVMGVDYNPYGVLAEVVRESGITNTLQLPSKTSMGVTLNEVVVAVGYRAAEKVLWKKLPE